MLVTTLQWLLQGPEIVQLTFINIRLHLLTYMSTIAEESKAFAENWLSEFSDAVYEKDVSAFTSLFLPNGWFRDVLVFDWDNRSLAGPEKIRSYIAGRLHSSNITNIRLDERQGLEPSFFAVSADLSGVEAAFRFEAPAIWGRGFIRLLPSSNGSWKALSVFMTVDDIKGHEEADHESGLYRRHTLTWQDVIADRHRAIEEDPQVLVRECSLIIILSEKHYVLINASRCRPDWPSSRGSS